MLRAIRLDVKWLQSALIFGYHNVKTTPQGGRTNKRFLTKANLSAYLRSCYVQAGLLILYASLPKMVILFLLTQHHGPTL